MTVPSPANHVAVILAAGGGSRFHGPGHKLTSGLPPTTERPAETVVARAVAAAVDAAIGPVVVVTGAVAEDELVDLLAPSIVDAVETTHNDRWADGQATSVALAIAAARRHGADRAVIGLGDQPGITPEAWRDVAATDGSIVVATYDGRRGNPVALHSDTWNLVPTDGDEGARHLMRLRPDLVVEVPCSGSPDDIDTTEDLRRWQNNSSTNSP